MNKDLQIARYFIPPVLSGIHITPDDEKMFIDWSSRGKHKDKLKQSHFNDGFNALVWGKKYTGITIHELWEPCILEGTITYWTLLGGENPKEILPRFVVDFLKREIFKGADSEIIEKCYKAVIDQWPSLMTTKEVENV